MADRSRRWPNHLNNTLILAVPSVDDVNRPRLDELTAEGVLDLTCDLTSEGLDIQRPTDFANFNPWFGNHVRRTPTRWTPDVVLQSIIPPQCGRQCQFHSNGDDCCRRGVLWREACRIRCEVVLVIRRGCPVDTPLHVGQEVEVLRGRWGARNISPLADGAALFSVPVGVSEEAGFDPRDEAACSGTTRIRPGTTPLPCEIVLCDGDGRLLCDDQNACFVNCREVPPPPPEPYLVPIAICDGDDAPLCDDQNDCLVTGYKWVIDDPITIEGWPVTRGGDSITIRKDYP